MSSYSADNNLSHAGRRPMVIAAQLYKAATSMYHIDEMFQWLADVIVSNFDVQATQIWTLQASRTGQISVQLRRMVYQEQLFPETSIVNNKDGNTAGSIHV